MNPVTNPDNLLRAYLRADNERANRAHALADAAVDAAKRLWPVRWLRQPTANAADLMVPRVDRGLGPAWLRVSYTLGGWRCSARCEGRDFDNLGVVNVELSHSMNGLLALLRDEDVVSFRAALGCERETASVEETNLELESVEEPNPLPSPNPLPNHILRLLAYSWVPIEFKYADLTQTEKVCLTAEEFEATAEQVRSYLNNNPAFAGWLETA